MWFGSLKRPPYMLGSLHQLNNNIDARNEFSDPKNLLKDMAIFRNWYFQTGLAASGILDATFVATISLNHLRMAKMDSATQKTLKWHITCVYVQKIIMRPFLRLHLASGSLCLKKFPTLVPKYENTAQMWMISKRMRSISKKMRAGTHIVPLPHVFGGFRWPPNMPGRPALV